MINASFDRSDPRDTTRGGVSLAPHAKSSMGGARMRNTKARGSVDCTCVDRDHFDEALAVAAKDKL